MYNLTIYNVQFMYNLVYLQFKALSQHRINCTFAKCPNKLYIVNP